MTTLVSLFIITMIPIDWKINNFSLYLFVCFFKDFFLVRAQLLIMENLLASMLHIYSFLAHYAAL